MSLLEELKLTLIKDERLVSDNELLKNKIVELALKSDKNLIKLLLSNKNIKEHFFVEINEILIFDKEKLMKFIDNKEFLPDSFTAFKNKIGLISDKQYLSKSKEVVLAWPYKDCILEGGMKKEDEKRREIFHNEILAPDEIDRLLDPKVFTNFKKIDSKGIHSVINIKLTDNFIIKGNNLLVLYSLKKKFSGKVKLIYIDPPFNRKVDTFYNDNFKHSTWLTFMKNRIEVAKELLTEDGILCVHLDDIELAYFKVLVDEIIGRDNYLNTVTLTTNDPSGFKATGSSIFSTANYLLFYQRGIKKPDIKKVYVKAEYDSMYNKVLEKRDIPFEKWNWKNIQDIVAEEQGFTSKRDAIKNFGKEVFLQYVSEFAIDNANRVFRTAAIQGGAKKKRKKTIEKSRKTKDKVLVHPNEDVPNFYILNGEQILFYEDRIVYFGNEKAPGKLITDVWTDISWTGIANEGRVTLKNGKKPEKLLKRIIEMCTKQGELVLDYHLGSGTTCAVAHKMGRQYIGVEQLCYDENDGVVRLKNVINGDTSGISKDVNWKGGGDFVYCELMKWNQIFIDKIQIANTKEKLQDIWKEMKKDSFLSYRVDPKDFDVNTANFINLSLEKQKEFLIECLDKNDLYVNYSEMNDAQYNIKKEGKELNKKFYKGI